MAKMNVIHIHIIDAEANSFNPVTKPADKMIAAATDVGGVYVLN